MGRTEKQLSGKEASLCCYSLLPGDAFDDAFGKQRKQKSLVIVQSGEPKIESHKVSVA